MALDSRSARGGSSHASDNSHQQALYELTSSPRPLRTARYLTRHHLTPAPHAGGYTDHNATFPSFPQLAIVRSSCDQSTAPTPPVCDLSIAKHGLLLSAVLVPPSAAVLVLVLVVLAPVPVWAEDQSYNRTRRSHPPAANIR